MGSGHLISITLEINVTIICGNLLLYTNYREKFEEADCGPEMKKT